MEVVTEIKHLMFSRPLIGAMLLQGGLIPLVQVEVMFML